MRALTVVPRVAASAAVVEIPEPAPSDGSVLVEVAAVGVCGTDREILAGEYGEAPAGAERLVLGHESLGRVVAAPADSGLAEGDLVVGVVRHPDPEPCVNCAAGEWDMCRNGRYTEHGIKGLHGFARERYREEPDWLVRVDPGLGDLGVLLEPASVVAKAWEHTERIAHRAAWSPSTCLITGAGPIGLLAALLAVQRGLDVHVVDLATDGPKPELVRSLGATYHATPVQEIRRDFDVAMECTGVPQVIHAALDVTGPNGVVCLTGVSGPGRKVAVDLGALNREWVLENDAVFGSVNANRRHYEIGAQALAEADKDWLAGIVRRRVPVEQFADAIDQRTDDVKTVITF